jgi:hypothetical protein
MTKQQIIDFLEWYDSIPNLSQHPLTMGEAEEVADQFLQEHPSADGWPSDYIKSSDLKDK